MSGAEWHAVGAALDLAQVENRTVEVWLRDDDAIAATPPLRRLAAVCEDHGLPVLLAVIPKRADVALTRFLEKHSSIVPTQHGYSHANHAAPGDRALELGGQRALSAVIDDLARGRDRMAALFGSRAAAILVPPWNRIDAAVIPALPALGFTALSIFGPPTTADAINVVNCSLDIIDWRNGRVGHGHAKLAGKLATLIAEGAATRQPIGLLTHHLVHDETAWTFLDACLARLRAHPAVHFTSAQQICDSRARSAVAES